MTEQQNEATLTPEQSLKAWVAPTFERTSLNEAMAGATHLPPYTSDGTTAYS